MEKCAFEHFPQLGRVIIFLSNMRLVALSVVTGLQSLFSGRSWTRGLDHLCHFVSILCVSDSFLFILIQGWVYFPQ